MAEANDGERQEAELALIQAMHPDTVQYNERSSDLKYSDEHGTLVLRLPSDYPSCCTPTVLSAQLQNKALDIREHMRKTISHLTPGEESLDLIISAFHDHAAAISPAGTNESSQSQDTQSQKSTTCSAVIIWLHHLLATEKRKLATRPADSRVSGVSKPGYPGVMIFSGPSTGVQDHVAELRGLNWQAFQVRYDVEEEWRFAHGVGVKEVESMGEITQEIGERWKGVFLEAMRMKT